MKKWIKHPVIILLGEALLLTALISLLVGLLGRLGRWESPVAYSNAFFFAGLLIFVGGAISRISAGQGMFNFPSLTAESYKNMDSAERFRHIIKANSPIRLVILGALSGAFLVLISMIFAGFSG